MNSSPSVSPDPPETTAGSAVRLVVEVNGEARSLDAPCTISDLLATLDLGDKRVAVAVNRDVVCRSRHPEYPLGDGDRIEILEAVGGG